jgi:O-antigen ligase
MKRLKYTVFVLLLASIPIGFRILLYQFTSGFHEYTSGFFYVSDSFLLAIIGLFLSSKPRLLIRKNIPFLVFVFLIAVSVFLSLESLLASYHALRTILFIVLALALSYLFHEKKYTIMFFGLIAGFAVLESLLAIAQFTQQGSIGFALFGEQSIAVTDPGTSRIWLNGFWALRAYGTFLHPNVLASFLVLGLLSLYYFWFVRPQFIFQVTQENYGRMFKQYLPFLYRSIIGGVGIFLVLTGIALTFSRAAWGIAGLLSFTVLVYGFAQKHYRREALKLLVILLISMSLISNILEPFVSPRANISLNEPAVTERIEYANIGMRIVREHPFGVGIGNQVLYSAKNKLYQNQGFTTSQKWQPVHNSYLLIATEIGVLGLFAFLWIVLSAVRSVWKRKKEPEVFLKLLLLSSLLLFALTDHFIWDLYQGQLMFWIALGVVFASQGKS